MISAVAAGGSHEEDSHNFSEGKISSSEYMSCFLVDSNSYHHQLKMCLFTQKPTALSAPAYHDRLFEWIYGQIVDESIFPQDKDVDFPKNFKAACKKILARMFREVFGKLFWSGFGTWYRYH